MSRLLSRRNLFKAAAASPIARLVPSLNLGAEVLTPLARAALIFGEAALPRFTAQWLAGASAASLGLVPVTGYAATNFLWSGAGSYNAGRTTWLSTELNALGNNSGNTLSTLGGAFQNTSSWIYYDVEFLSGGTVSPAAGAFIELWHLRSLDGGTNYEDGSASVAPGRPADITIQPRAGTTITPRSGANRGVLPPAFYKPIARNQMGVSMAATSNVISFSAYTEQY